MPIWVQRADLLLSQLGQPSYSLDTLDRLPTERKKWLLVDGLNEVRSSKRLNK